MSATAPNMRSMANTKKIATMAVTVGVGAPVGVAVGGESSECAKAASFRRKARAAALACLSTVASQAKYLEALRLSSRRQVLR